ncbi:hypothetical protein LMIY3S_02721 [Labrys miyagiensis]
MNAVLFKFPHRDRAASIPAPRRAQPVHVAPISPDAVARKAAQLARGLEREARQQLEYERWRAVFASAAKTWPTDPATAVRALIAASSWPVGLRSFVILAGAACPEASGDVVTRSVFAVLGAMVAAGDIVRMQHPTSREIIFTTRDRPVGRRGQGRFQYVQDWPAEDRPDICDTGRNPPPSAA